MFELFEALEHAHEESRFFLGLYFFWWVAAGDILYGEREGIDVLWALVWSFLKEIVEEFDHIWGSIWGMLFEDRFEIEDKELVWNLVWWDTGKHVEYGGAERVVIGLDGIVAEDLLGGHISDGASDG